jgi:hypothetical protein
MDATDPILPTLDEPSTESEVLLPPPTLVGAEGRLHAGLREAARTRDPVEILTRSAVAYYTATCAEREDDPTFRALADLAVTGRDAYGRLREASLSEARLVPAVRARLAAAGARAAQVDIEEAAAAALDRAYGVAWALRGPHAHRASARKALGWIAVSSEDDPPHRPVNVPSAAFPQYEIPVTVAGLPALQTRFFVASQGASEEHVGAVSARSAPPDPIPHVREGDQVILFLHGHSSSAEEASGLIPWLLEAGTQHGTRFSIISLDLPSNGYSSRIDHTAVAPSSATRSPAWPTDEGPVHTPLLDFLESFVVAFVDALDRHTPIKHRFAGVIGGSLGGNLGLRLGRRDVRAFPWLGGGIVSWSPASVWRPFVNDLIKRLGPNHCRDNWDLPETEASRTAYFTEVFDEPMVRVLLPQTQPESWFRDGWSRKAHAIRSARFARHETYDPVFRRWHWRVAGEQLIFSHVDRTDRESAASPFRYELNRVRHLLMAGEKDDLVFSNIYSATRALAARMLGTPGRSVFLRETGHSIHAERPRYLAGEIARFLTVEARAGARKVVT